MFYLKPSHEFSEGVFFDNHNDLQSKFAATMYMLCTLIWKLSIGIITEKRDSMAKSNSCLHVESKKCLASGLALLLQSTQKQKTHYPIFQLFKGYVLFIAN